MSDEQKQIVFALIEKGLNSAGWFEEQGGKVIITFPKPILLEEREVKVSVIMEDYHKI